MSILINKYLTKADIDTLQTVKNDVFENQINVTCIGLYNHGKSTLLNVLIEDFKYKTFKTADIRETAQNKSVQYKDITFIDTPGLNAQVNDDKKVMDAIRSSDISLFVHNITTGEFNKKEIEFLETIEKYWKNPKEFIERTIFVVSRIDNIEKKDDISVSVERMENQIFEIFNVKPTIIPVSSERYRKGKVENKKVLISKSNINNLRHTLDSLVLKSKELIKKTKKERLETEYRNIIQKLNHRVEENQLKISQLKREKVSQDIALHYDIERIERILESKYLRLRGE